MSEDNSSTWWKIGLIILGAFFVLNSLRNRDEDKGRAVMALCAGHGGFERDLLDDEYAPRGKFIIECSDGTVYSGDMDHLDLAHRLEPDA